MLYVVKACLGQLEKDVSRTCLWKVETTDELLTPLAARETLSRCGSGYVFEPVLCYETQ